MSGRKRSSRRRQTPIPDSPARRTRSRTASNASASSASDVPRSGAGLPPTPRRSTRLRTRSDASQTSAPQRRLPSGGMAAVPEEEEEEEEEVQAGAGEEEAAGGDAGRSEDHSEDSDGGDEDDAGESDGGDEHDAGKSDGDDDDEAGESDSSDDDDSDDSDGEDSDDAELDHLVAISSAAINAFAAKAPKVRKGGRVSAYKAAAAAASLTLAGSSEAFAGMRNGATYLSFGDKRGVAAVEVADAHRQRAIPKVHIDANTEKKTAAPVVEKKQAKQKKTTSNTFGKQWFNVANTPMTAAVKRDLQIIQMRNYLDPKRYYKAADNKGLPKNFQVGTVVEAAHEFKTGRLTKRQRKATIADSLLADAHFRKYARRSYDAVSRAANNGRNTNKRKNWWGRLGSR